MKCRKQKKREDGVLRLRSVDARCALSHFRGSCLELETGIGNE